MPGTDICAPQSMFASLVDSLVPREDGLVALINAYFDESYSDDRKKVLCISGILFDSEKAKIFDSQLGRILNKYSLPYFRMSACAHGNAPFGHLSRDERIDAEKEVIEAIRDNMIFGITSAVSQTYFDEAFPVYHPEIGSAYSFCCESAIVGVGVWAMKNGYDGKIAYFFEAGHQFQAEANRVMTGIFLSDSRKRRTRYLSHTFVDKMQARPVQAADLLAYLSGKMLKDYRVRADLKALTDNKPFQIMYHSKEEISEFSTGARIIQKGGIPYTGTYGGNPISGRLAVTAYPKNVS